MGSIVWGYPKGAWINGAGVRRHTYNRLEWRHRIDPSDFWEAELAGVHHLPCGLIWPNILPPDRHTWSWLMSAHPVTLKRYQSHMSTKQHPALPWDWPWLWRNGFPCFQSISLNLCLPLLPHSNRCGQREKLVGARHEAGNGDCLPDNQRRQVGYSISVLSDIFLYISPCLIRRGVMEITMRV